MVLTSHVIAAVDFVDLDVAARTNASDFGRLELRLVSKISSVSLPLFIGFAIERREPLLLALFFSVELVFQVTLVFRRISLLCSSKAFTGTALFTSLAVMERDVAG